MKLLIYTPRITHRIRYIFSLFFEHLGKIDYEITSDSEIFDIDEAYILNYSPKKSARGIHFPPSGLLLESGIKDLEPVLKKDGKLLGAFPTPNNQFISFDIFASAFYLSTRYEEYLPHLRDQYDRFDAKYSFAFKNGFLRKAMINHYAIFLFDLIESIFPDLHIKRSKYSYLNSIDIDNAWAYRQKGFVRTTAAISKDILTFNYKNLGRRLGVLLGQKKDPYDNYQYLFDIQDKYNLKSLYFFLLADYGLNDKNVPVWSKKFQSLIKVISDRAKIGIHPSFGSNKKPEKLAKEIERLSLISKFEVIRSRQHFLILNMPETYRRLIQHEIKEDYSMGFATEVGFRASICTPYPFYDLDREEQTKLMLYPFAVMEATLKFYMETSQAQACEIIDSLVDEVKSVDGLFISLWHNETVSNEGLWSDWRRVYEHLVQKAVS
jgi:hypothetical protein